jgi:hypothetical protein
MRAITTIGLDIAKSVFQVHGVDADGNVVIRRQLKRRYVLAFFQKLPPCLIGSAGIDQGWPHQVVLPVRLCERDGYNEIHEFCRDLPFAREAMRFFTTVSGFTSIASRKQRTRRGRLGAAYECQRSGHIIQLRLSR